MDLVARWLHESAEETRKEARKALGFMADAAIEAGKAARGARRKDTRTVSAGLAQGYISSCVMLAKAMYGKDEAEQLRTALVAKTFSG